MAMILYFDAFSGISGDMTLAALIELTDGFEYVKTELCKLNLAGWSVSLERKVKNGIDAAYINVAAEESSSGHHSHGEHDSHSEHDKHHSHRKHSDIARMIESGGITAGAKAIALRIFLRLAEAEAKIHGVSVADVSFHEVGAVDSIIDIVGTAILLDKIKPDKIMSSVVSDGHGFIKCRHGIIPVPVPATAEVFAARGVRTRQIDVESELVTPTGAAIIAEAESYGLMPEMNIAKTAYGAGTKDFAHPNVLRAVLGETTEAENSVSAAETTQNGSAAIPTQDSSAAITAQNDSAAIPTQNDNAEVTTQNGNVEAPAYSENVSIIEANIDDCTAEILAYAAERLMESGARDVFFTPIMMKKSRPATKLSVICDIDKVKPLSDIIFAETTTIGVRVREEKRIILPRSAEYIDTVYGKVKVKSAGGKISPEYEVAAKIAREQEIPLREVYANLTVSSVNIQEQDQLTKNK
ncbi:UPF0272 protein [Clostridia bacterium]|nr:UPF0272 protein [Clostridia bacterium]